MAPVVNLSTLPSGHYCRLAVHGTQPWWLWVISPCRRREHKATQSCPQAVPRGPPCIRQSKQNDAWHTAHFVLAQLKWQCCCVRVYSLSNMSSFELFLCYHSALLCSWTARRTSRPVNVADTPFCVFMSAFHFLQANGMWELKKKKKSYNYPIKQRDVNKSLMLDFPVLPQCSFQTE